MLSQTGVAVLPGSDFGLPDDQLFVRMAFVDFDGAAALEGLKAQSGHSGDALSGQFVKKYCPKLVKACDEMLNWLNGF